jgi:hypothetical protein
MKVPAHMMMKYVIIGTKTLYLSQQCTGDTLQKAHCQSVAFTRQLSGMLLTLKTLPMLSRIRLACSAQMRMMLWSVQSSGSRIRLTYTAARAKQAAQSTS